MAPQVTLPSKVLKDRNELLMAMGFTSYKDYLESNLWNDIRQRVFARDHRRCRMCRSKAQVVHHHQYDHRTLTGKSLDHLFSLCHNCHLKVHTGTPLLVFKPAQLDKTYAKPKRVKAPKSHRNSKRKNLASFLNNFNTCAAKLKELNNFGRCRRCTCLGHRNHDDICAKCLCGEINVKHRENITAAR